ncbi:2Fe-2S ferredoxin [Janthinobacterium lividum]|nr:2Fe-2S ferredoxin [Janthinobacterium lividum]
MPQIVILPHAKLCPDGAVIEAPAGKSICDILLENDIDIEHACENRAPAPPATCWSAKASNR